MPVGQAVVGADGGHRQDDEDGDRPGGGDVVVQGARRSQREEVQPCELAVFRSRHDQDRLLDLPQGIDRVFGESRGDAGLHRRRDRQPRRRRIDDLARHDGVDGFRDRRELFRRKLLIELCLQQVALLALQNRKGAHRFDRICHRLGQEVVERLEHAIGIEIAPLPARPTM